jgi:protocatechuate 3,4-dioxygenase beta subunit
MRAILTCQPILRVLSVRGGTLHDMHRVPLTRRQALGTSVAVSLGGLLAACGADDETASVATTTEPAATGTTGTTGTTTVQPRTSTRLTAEQFDSAATCEVATELTEGPYYFDVDSVRSDIREDREGTLLRLGVRVRDAGSCEPIENAIVDVWHCDALGTYSGFESASQGGRSGGRTDDETYLRGAQATNADGIVEFRTIYPGWYPGRTTHIHAKVHLDRQTLLTTQFFTTREVDDVVFARAPYNQDPGRDTFNETDGIYAESGGLTLSEEGDAVLGLITVDVQRT